MNILNLPMLPHDAIAPEPANPTPATLADASPAEYIKMLEACSPILKAEYLACLFMRAELVKAGDVQVKKAQFMKAAGRLDRTKPLPPMTDAALRVVVNSNGPRARSH